VAATINSPINSTAQHLAKDVESVGSLVISRASVEVEQGDKDDSSNQILSMKTTVKKHLWWIARHPRNLQGNSLPIYISYMEKKQK